jgi:hypothetical protein
VAWGIAPSFNSSPTTTANLCARAPAQFFNRNLLMAALAVTLVLGVVIALGLSRSATRQC